MTEFKVGNFARHIVTNDIIKITKVTSETINGYPLACYIPWNPYIGELIWVWQNGYKYGAALLSFIGFSENTTHNVQVQSYQGNSIWYYDYCEPFIGELPSSI